LQRRRIWMRDTITPWETAPAESLSERGAT
jgi:hypothetical protein